MPEKSTPQVAEAFQHVNLFVDGAIVAIATAIVGLVVWVLRVIFTNQKQINTLVAEIEAREHLRKAEHETIEEIRQDIREVRHDVRSLWREERHHHERDGSE